MQNMPFIFSCSQNKHCWVSEVGTKATRNGENGPFNLIAHHLALSFPSSLLYLLSPLKNINFP